MRILAIDPGTQMGWCYAESGILESGAENFAPKRGDSRGMRYLLFNRWLADAAKDATMIAYERSHMRGGAATEILHGFTTRIDEMCAVNDLDSMAVHSATIKKHATGSGKASKDDMLEAAIHAWPEQFYDKVIAALGEGTLKANHPAYDQADALFLMSYILTVV